MAGFPRHWGISRIVVRKLETNVTSNAAQKLSSEPGPKHERRLTPLALAALGVVFGDIGTSPLYAFKLAFTAGNLAPSTSTVLGILSLITWALILVVCIKYATVVLHADNDGEGVPLRCSPSSYHRVASEFRLRLRR